jgi:hypothetical protein
VLAAYRPPASIERHTDFIRASASLKEAHELDALGLRHGALLRYLQAAQRFAPSAAVPAGPPDALEARLREYDARLASRERDDSIGRLFLETAQSLAAPARSRTWPWRRRSPTSCCRSTSRRSSRLRASPTPRSRARR